MAKPKLSIASLPAGFTLPPMAPLIPVPAADAPAPATTQEDNKLTKQQANKGTPNAKIPSSKDKKLVAFRVSRPTARQLEKMAWEEDLTLQAFLLKTINHYRASRGLDPLPE
jgi:hypothetical protein